MGSPFGNLARVGGSAGPASGSTDYLVAMLSLVVVSILQPWPESSEDVIGEPKHVALFPRSFQVAIAMVVRTAARERSIHAASVTRQRGNIKICLNTCQQLESCGQLAIKFHKAFSNVFGMPSEMGSQLRPSLPRQV